MSQSTTTESDVQQVAAAIKANESFLVVAHENPDGDALGSMLATSIALRALGKDVVMYLSGDAPTPGEYGFLDLSDLRRTLPDDLEERVLLALDCAS
jgi:phosphoesterase RecJ-like protein